MVRMSVFVGALCSLLFFVGSASAATIDLNVHPKSASLSTTSVDGDVFGVHIDRLYYTVVTEGDVVKKIELNGSEEVDFVVRTTWDDVLELALKYRSGISWVETAGFLVNKFGVPVDRVLGVMS